MKEIYVSCGSVMGSDSNTKNELYLRLKKLGYAVISKYKTLIVATSTLILSDLAEINFITGTLSEAKLDGVRADLLFYKYGDFYLNENASRHFKTCIVYDDTEVISRYIDSIIREDISDRLHSLLNYTDNATIAFKVKEAIKDAAKKPLIFDQTRMECVCPQCERITDAPWDDDKSPFYCRYCGQKIIFPIKEN